VGCAAYCSGVGDTRYLQYTGRASCRRSASFPTRSGWRWLWAPPFMSPNMKAVSRMSPPLPLPHFSPPPVGALVLVPCSVLRATVLLLLYSSRGHSHLKSFDAGFVLEKATSAARTCVHRRSKGGPTRPFGLLHLFWASVTSISSVTAGFGRTVSLIYGSRVTAVHYPHIWQQGERGTLSSSMAAGLPRGCRAPEGRKAVDELHKRYMNALRQLWDVHKGRFAIDRKRTLQIIDELPVPIPPAVPLGADQDDTSGSSSCGTDSGPET
jgi:hypothetical protein